MMSFLFPMLAGVLSLAIQTTFWNSLSLQVFRPDLLLILVVYLGLSYPPVSGGILAFFIGSLADLFSGHPVGLYALSRPLVFYGVQHFRNRFYLEGLPFQFLFVFLSAVLEGLWILFLVSSLSPVPSLRLSLSLFSPFIPQSVSTGLVAPFCFLLFNKALPFFLKKNGQEKLKT